MRRFGRGEAQREGARHEEEEDEMEEEGGEEEEVNEEEVEALCGRALALQVTCR